MPSVVLGLELFKQRLQGTDETLKNREICTVSDEAFALLLLENSYDRWKDIFEKRGGIPQQHRGEKKRQCDSDIAPKYTNGGIRYSSTVQHKTKGWTKEGIQRYNELFQLVGEDRERHPKFLQRLKAKQMVPKSTRKQSDQPELVTAVHSLWEKDNSTNVAEYSQSESSEDEDSVVAL